MEKMNTSSQRVDSLMQLSDRIYPAIDTIIENETRSRRTLRVGISTVAHVTNTKSVEIAGKMYEQLLVAELGRGGITSSDYKDFPTYASHMTALPGAEYMEFDQLKDLSNSYADVQRQTLDTTGQRESNARHAIHLSALALPYAKEFYPELDQPLVAVYCLIHDILEAYTDDVPSLGITAAMEAQREIDEPAALELLAFEYGYDWPTFVAIIKDYEHRATPEAIFVKTFDKLDPAYTHYANRGHQFIHYYNLTSVKALQNANDARTKKIEVYGNQFPLVMEDRLEILKRVTDHVEWPVTKTIIA